MFPIPQCDWCPRPIAFKNYHLESKARLQQHAGPSSGLSIHRSPLSVRLTTKIVDTYHICNPSFQCSESIYPKRYLTRPFEGVSNDGSDNENHDLILHYGQILASDDNARGYVVKDIVGDGTFGQVAKCLSVDTKVEVAVKIIKNLPAYSTQARHEIGILHMLNSTLDKRSERYIVRSFDHFTYKGHLCIVFELLETTLYELLKLTKMKGVSLFLTKDLVGQLLHALSVLYDARIIHCDVKPENVMLSLNGTSKGEIKLIDFGSACLVKQTIYSYIQSRFYRAPEVVLGHAYSAPIDMWSLGCVAAELFLGFPLFPGQCEYDLLRLMFDKLGKRPPDHIIRNSKHWNKYFKLIAPALYPGNDHTTSAYQFLNPEEYERVNKKPANKGSGKGHFLQGSLEEMIINVPVKEVGNDEEIAHRKVFIDFLRGLLEVDPFKRLTPYQASQHPFITGDRFNGPFIPQKEVPHGPLGIPLGHEIEHNVSSQFHRSHSSLATPHPFTGDDHFITPPSPRKEKKRVVTALGPPMEQNANPEPGHRDSPPPHEPFAESVGQHQHPWPLSLYMTFSDFALLFFIILEPLFNICTSLMDHGRLLVGFLIQFLGFYFTIERYGKRASLRRHKWRVSSRDLKTNRFLGQGFSGIVYETTWSGRQNLGLLARKDFPAVGSDVFEIEADGLVELSSHANVVNCLCWTIDRQSCSLVMEYVRHDLYSVIQKIKGEHRAAAASDNYGSSEQASKDVTQPFELLTSIDLILKVALGMRHLHSRGIAHGDLKPSNVLICSEISPSSVKVTDFGLTNTKRRSTTLVSFHARCLQTVKWKAPELFDEYLDNTGRTASNADSNIAKRSSGSNAGIFSNTGLRRADIYSFALTCSHILGVQNWDPGMNWMELRRFISHGLRPKLPSGCPKSLASLISSCWAADPLCRPTFASICKQLQILKSEQIQLSEGHWIHYPDRLQTGLQRTDSRKT